MQFQPFATTALGGPQGAWLGAPFSVTISGSGTVVTGSPSFGNYAFQNNQFYGIKSRTYGVDANGKEVKCGFDDKCSDDDRFTFAHFTGAKMAAPSAGNQGVSGNRGR